ncbi:hypothetical protein [Promicromonospora xylanilytica]
MNLTRAARSQPLVAPRREAAGVLAVVLSVLTVLGVQILCGIHLEGGHGGAHAAAGHHAAPAVPGSSHDTVVTDPGHHHGADGNHCSEDRAAPARYDRTLSPFPDLVEAPYLAHQWLVPGTAHDGPRVPAGVAERATPSLHALGISRT